MTETIFILAAAFGVAVALAFALYPLLGGGAARRSARRALRALEARRGELDQDEYRRRREPLVDALVSGETAGRPGLLAIAIALLIPAATVVLYTGLGTPEALDETGENRQAREINQSLSRLARRLERNPDDIQGWTTLGLTYKRMEEFSSAEQALRRARSLAPDDPDIAVELAETLLFGSRQPRLPTEARHLLEQALEIRPDNQKALWLLGMDAFQNGDFQGALDYWRKLETILPEGSVRASVRQQIARAEQHAGQPPPTAPPQSDDSTDEAPGPRIAVSVSLDPALAGKVSGNETLFVYARATQGPPMPLAIRRLSASELPVTIVLDTEDAMMPDMNLAGAEQVMINARISASGQATPQPGDLMGESGPATVADSPAVEVRIDQVVE